MDATTESELKIPVVDDDIIEAGAVVGIEPGRVVSFNENRHRAETSRTLAFIAIGVLGGLILLQYAAVTILSLYGKDAVAQKLTELFQGLLPVVSGLAVSAYTFYFTRER